MILLKIDQKTKTFDSSYFRDKSHFEKDDAQNYLMLQPINRYFKKINGVGNDANIQFWKSKGLFEEKINSLTASN